VSRFAHANGGTGTHKAANGVVASSTGTWRGRMLGNGGGPAADPVYSFVRMPPWSIHAGLRGGDHCIQFGSRETANAERRTNPFEGTGGAGLRAFRKK
jgi:hypothetical protein